MIKKTTVQNQAGFAHIIFFIVLAVVVGAAIYGGYTFVTKQREENAAKTQAIETANEELSKVKEDLKIPEGWERVTIDDGSTLILPKGYSKYNAIDDVQYYNNPQSSTEITLYPLSMPKMRYGITGSSYCQLSNDTWITYEDVAAASLDINSKGSSYCSKVVAGNIGDNKTYMIENHNKDSTKVFITVKLGESYYAFSDSQSFNNYGEEAILAITADQKTNLTEIAQKFVDANK